MFLTDSRLRRRMHLNLRHFPRLAVAEAQKSFEEALAEELR